MLAANLSMCLTNPELGLRQRACIVAVSSPISTAMAAWTWQSFASMGQLSSGGTRVWCGDMAYFVEPLCELMADQVRASHVVATDDNSRHEKRLLLAQDLGGNIRNSSFFVIESAPLHSCGFCFPKYPQY